MSEKFEILRVFNLLLQILEQNLHSFRQIGQILPMSRIENTLRQIQYAIQKARDSVESDIMESNKDKAILGIANFLGSK